MLLKSLSDEYQIIFNLVLGRAKDRCHPTYRSNPALFCPHQTLQVHDSTLSDSGVGCRIIGEQLNGAQATYFDAAEAGRHLAILGSVVAARHTLSRRSIIIRN
jgi:hypothetical protein